MDDGSLKALDDVVLGLVEDEGVDLLVAQRRARPEVDKVLGKCVTHDAEDNEEDLVPRVAAPGPVRPEK